MGGPAARVVTPHTTLHGQFDRPQFGKQPYTDENSARDVWWLSPILCGENYHNYHTVFKAITQRHRWYQWDPTKWALWLLSRTPLVKDLRRAPTQAVLRAKLEMDCKRIEKRFIRCQKFWQPFKNASWE